MIVTRLEAVSWRNFRRIDVPLERRVFAVGANAAGKTNFLDIFRFLSDLSKRGGGLYNAVAERGGVETLQCRVGECSGFEIAVTLGTDEEPEQWRYELGVARNPPENPPVLEYERVFKNGEKILDRPESADSGDPVRLEETFLENATTNAGFREIAEFFARTVYLGSFPAGVPNRQRGGRYPGAVSDEPFQKLVSDVMSVPAEERKARISRIESMLRLIIPQLRELHLTNPNGGMRLETIFEHWRPGEKISQENFSEGTLRLIGILWALLSNDSLLLMEEPELSLHPSVVRLLPGLLYRLKGKRGGQKIVTTHSQELLSDPGIGGREVILFLPAEDGGVSVVSAADLPESKALIDAGMSIGEVVLPRSQPPGIDELGFFE